MPDLRRRASVKNRSRSGPKKGQSGSAYVICCSLSEGGTAFGSVWPISIPEKLKAAMPLASKIHRGANMESLRAHEACADNVIVNPRTGYEFQNIFRAPYHQRQTRLNRQPRVYDDSMTKPAGWIGVILAGLLSVLSSPAQTLSNQSLSGKYYFRHLSLGTDGVNPGSLPDPRTLMGAITFDGSGHYSYIGQQLTGINAAVSQTGSGAYSLDPGGFLSLDSPLRAGAKINARFATEAVIGSSTEATDNTYDLFVAIPAPSGGAVFSGPYNCMSLEFPGGATANMRSTQFPLNQLAPGSLQPFSVFGHAAGISQGQPLTQQIAGATYTMGADGLGGIRVG